MPIFPPKKNTTPLTTQPPRQSAEWAFSPDSSSQWMDWDSDQSDWVSERICAWLQCERSTVKLAQSYYPAASLDESSEILGAQLQTGPPVFLLIAFQSDGKGVCHRPIGS